jgi:hypothetical protein
METCDVQFTCQTGTPVLIMMKIFKIMQCVKNDCNRLAGGGSFTDCWSKTSNTFFTVIIIIIYYRIQWHTHTKNMKMKVYQQWTVAKCEATYLTYL